jgi:hypothetical protein
MNSVYLCDALLSHPEHYDMVAPHLEDLREASRWLVELREPSLVELESTGELLQTIIFYAQKYKQLPDRKGTLDAATEIMSRGARSGHADSVRTQLALMDERIEEAHTPPVQDVPTDINVLIEATISAARKLWHHQNGLVYSNKALGHSKVKLSDGGERESTPDDAIAWLRKQWTKDLRRMSFQPSGELSELGAEVEAEIDRMVSGDDSERVLTGFQCLDEKIYISKKRRQFIGIMGFANDGKTTFLLTMLYNMAVRGKSVILFSKEHDATELALCFAFIHSHHECYRERKSDLPSLREFEERRATTEDGEFLKGIWRDMEARKNFLGRIEIQPLTDWDTLTEHLKTHQKRNRYDVCGVDYLTRLDIPDGNPRFHDQDIKNYIGMAQRFTRDFDDGRGIVLISPIQINRSGYQAAKKRKEGEKKHDLTSVSQFSEFYQDMDVVISLYSDELMRLKREVLLETQKVRKSGVRPCATLGIDPRSEKVVDLSLMGFDTETQRRLDGKTPMRQYVEKTIEADTLAALDVGAGA